MIKFLNILEKISENFPFFSPGMRSNFKSPTIAFSPRKNFYIWQIMKRAANSFSFDGMNITLHVASDSKDLTEYLAKKNPIVGIEFSDDLQVKNHNLFD
jgi:hypothetical protein